MRRLTCAAVLLAALHNTAEAANVIDPNGVGATDVVDLRLEFTDPFPMGTPTWLANPVADPLNLGTHILAVGYVSSGELRIDGGSHVLSTGGDIGYVVGSTGVVTVDGVGSNWTNSGVLRFGVFGGDGTLNITGGGAVSNANGLIGGAADSTHVVTVEGDGSTWTNSGLLNVGAYGADGTLNIIDGGAVSNAEATIGYSSGSTGAVIVDGNGSTWTSSDDLKVGQGTLLVQGGGAVSNLGGSIGSAGSVTVDGVGSTWTNSDDLDVADGTLDITGGGAVSSIGGSLGYYSGQTAAVTVDGAGSKWTASDTIIVGHLGEGTLTITGGAVVESSQGYLGQYSGSTGVVTVEGVGSTWTNGGDLVVGLSGGGTLNISNDAAVNVGGSTLAGDSGTISFNNGTLTTATLEVDSENLLGTGSIFTNGLFSDIGDIDLVFDATHGSSRTIHVNNQPGQNLTVHLDVNNAGWMAIGYRGAGSMSISDGVVVQNLGGFIGSEAGSTGVVTVAGTGSTWTTSGPVYVGGGGDATLTITDGAKVSSSTSPEFFFYGNGVGAGYNSSGQVTVDGPGSTWSNRDLAVGNFGDGMLTITDGGLVSVAGTLTIDNNLDGSGVINVATGGMLAVEGEADDSLAQFLDLVEGADAIRYWDNSSSDWADIVGAAHGDDYTLEYFTSGELAGYTLLTVGVPGLPGDYNDDGIVNAADYTVWRDNLGAPGDTVPNHNEVGPIGNAHYLTWKSHFGMRSPTLIGDARFAGVPEPATLVLSLLALGGAGFCWRRSIGR